MDITNIFCQSLGVTSHAKMFLTVYRFRTDRLGVSVQKKLSSVRTAWDIRLKKLLSVRTAWAIRSEKNLSTVRATEAICSKVNFSRVSIPKPFRCQPLASNDVLFSRSRTLRVLFTNVSYMNSYASLLLCSHLRFEIINRLSKVSTQFQSILKLFFFNKFPENNIFYLYAFVVYEPAERNFIFLACQEHKTRKIIFLIGCISSSLDCFSITKKLHESFPAR